MHTPHPSKPKAGGRADPEVIRPGELTVPASHHCHTWESRPCALLTQNNRANPVTGRGVGEPALKF